jgi:dihydrofolate reductase
MATILGYIGASLDGYIATPDGNLDWLRKYENIDMGEYAYDRFITGIRTVVMGRDTYDWIALNHTDWPYTGKRAIVVTSRPLPDPVGPVEVWSQTIDQLITHLRALDDGAVWMIGGGKLQQAFIERGALDRIEIFIVPELIGGGIPLFPPTNSPNSFPRTVTLLSAQPLPAGCVRLHYDLTRVPDMNRP